MVIKRKTQIILALLVTCIFLFQNCALIIPGTSKKRFQERREGDLIITKKDGHKIEGELNIVKENSLHLLDRYGKEVSIEIRDIRTIRILKRSKKGLGYLIGATIGMGIGVLAALSPSAGEDYSVVWTGVLLGSLLAIPGSILGGIAGAMAGIDETIQIEGMTDLQIKWVMDKLRKEARIRNYK